VVGLSTALRLQEKGYTTTIVAEYLPGDKKTIDYTSSWAVSIFHLLDAQVHRNTEIGSIQGAHHVSRAQGDKVQEGQLPF
jgi:UDP-N-acetylmuramyl tripeptide synthase